MLSTSASAAAPTPDYQASLKARAERRAPNAIGKLFSVRTAKRTTVNGIITNCQFHGFRQTPTTTSAIFKVTMECGTAKFSRDFYVKRIPQ